MAGNNVTANDILNLRPRSTLKPYRSTMSDNTDFEERTSFATYLLRNDRLKRFVEKHPKSKIAKMLSCSCLTPDRKFCELADYPLGCVYAPENEQD